MTHDSYTRHTVVLLAIVFEGGLVVLAFVAGQLLNQPSLELVQPSWRAFLIGLAATAPMIPLMLWLSLSSWPPFKRLMHEVEQTVVPMFSKCTTLDFALIAVLAGLGEEVLFRGLVQTGIAAPLGPWTALVISSVLFGMLHLVTRTYAVIATIFGVYLGWLYIVTGDLFAAVVTHAVYDFAALNYLVARTRKPTEEPTASL